MRSEFEVLIFEEKNYLISKKSLDPIIFAPTLVNN